MASYYPIFLDLSGAHCVVVGGGEVAARKARGLAETGARVTAVAPDFCSQFDALAGVDRLRRPYEASVLAGARVVIAATDDMATNDTVRRDAHAAGALVNVVDQPARCDFIVPATVVQGDLVLAVSTGGASPALAARVRRELEDAYPQVYAEFVALLREVREEVLGTVDTPARRKTIFARLAGHEFLASLVAEGPTTTLKRMRQFIREETRKPAASDT